MSSTGTAILLHPRPYAKFAGALLLLPLLPQPKPLKPLPSEIWTEILAFAFASPSACERAWPWSFLTICKSFCEIALPLLYASPRLPNIKSLETFYNRLHNADQKWDSIRRIPYSTPGRWVQSLDLSDMEFEGQAQALLLDSLLSQLFPLTPFLSTLSINPSFVLSRRALSSLAQRDGATNLRSLSGLSYIPPPTSVLDEDPFVQLLRQCPNLEVLVIIGQGLDPTELEFNFGGIDLPSLTMFAPLSLPNLRILSLLSMHSSPLMLALLRSPLPGLRKFTVTPYSDIPYPASLVSEFITTHGAALTSLLLFTPKSWPTRLRPSPTNLLTCAPSLNHLSLESPLPSLSLTEKHGLTILSIPRPTSDFWRVLEHLFPHLPNLSVLRARDVRWLRKGISSMAQEAGVQGEMREWKRRLDRRRIRLLDSDWNEHK
ncbi:hypothetical protein GALMADRAFT_53571 [Galerina marginata CBS 339.88]|uniref:F-box domain-containing protein n=1 Tax=Galerina marginata (strain CBS 339.88) TaxID=685588 RepID=A0A067TQZ7_GALM3|nr:hypothetical protein GALMADRAFT_53571 [Galerina marginata CBS 339.88]